MADSIDEFAAGLVLDNVQNSQASTQVPPESGAIANADTGATVQPSGSGWDSLRSKFAGIPDGVTEDDFADHILELQRKADEAEQLRQQLAQFQAQATQAAMQQAQGKPSGSPTSQTAPATEPEEIELPWKPVKIDPAFRNLVKVDPASGSYMPTNPTSPAHIEAAREMNRRQQYETQLITSLIDDPEQFVGVLTKKQIRELKAEFASQMEELKTQLKTVNEYTNQAQSQTQIQSFIAEHKSELFNEDDSLTKLGSLVDLAMKEDGLSPDKAYEKAIKTAQLLGLEIPAVQAELPAPKPAIKSISKAQPQTQPAAPRRMVDNARQRTQGNPPADRTPYDRSSGKWNRPLEEIIEEIDASFANSN